MTFIAHRVGQVKGFFRAEGLDIDLVQLQANIMIPALTSRDIDFAGVVGRAVDGAVRGIPVRAVLVTIRRPLHVLVVRPEIRSLTDLTGKTVSFTGPGDLTEHILRAILRSAKMAPEKDIQSFAIPGSGTRLSALISGKIDGAILPPPFNIEAEAKGFRRIMAGSEVYEGAISGLSTTSEKLRDNSGQVKRVVRALLKSQSFIKDNKNETVKIISDWLKLNLAVAAASYDIYTQVLSIDGLVSDQALKLEIERAVKAFKIGHEVPISNLVDFAILDAVLSEMKSPAAAR